MGHPRCWLCRRVKPWPPAKTLILWINSVNVPLLPYPPTTRDRGEEKMLFLKLVFLVFATIVVLVLFTYAWVVVQTPGPKWISSQGSVGIDVTLLSAMTLHSPLYWLVVVAILAAAGWLCRRWVF